MRPHRGGSPGLMPRTEAPPPISEGRTWKASRWEHLSRRQQSRGQSLALRACENEKSVLAIKLGAKAGCWLKAPDFASPSRFCPVPGFFFGRLKPRKRAILPPENAYVI